MLRSAIGHAPAAAGVTLASLHAAKGLEWDAVFLAGLTDGTVPIIYAQTDEAIEEERRLLYVGVTRARAAAVPVLVAGQGGRGQTRAQAVQVPGRADRRAPECAAASQRPAASSARAEQPAVDPDDPLFARLRAWRLRTAREQSVPAYVVFSDATCRRSRPCGPPLWPSWPQSPVWARSSWTDTVPPCSNSAPAPTVARSERGSPNERAGGARCRLD